MHVHQALSLLECLSQAQSLATTTMHVCMYVRLYRCMHVSVYLYFYVRVGIQTFPPRTLSTVGNVERGKCRQSECLTEMS